METFKSWALSAVTAATVAAVISLLTPSGNFEKTIKILITLFVLAAFVVPFVKSDVFADFSGVTDGIKEVIEDNELEKEVREEVADSLQNAVKAEISAYLLQNNIDVKYIGIKVCVEDDNNIFVEKITIALSEYIQTEEFEKYIATRFGVAPDFVLEQEVSDE